MKAPCRYRLARRRQDAVDGRSLQPEACAPLAGVIQAWIDDQAWDGSERPESVRSLFDVLVSEHDFVGSYKSVLRFVRRRVPPPKVQPIRRVETRPGAQAQVDWATRQVFVHDLGGAVKLKAFLMTLSHSRLGPLQFFENETQLSWLTGHNQCLEIVGGVPLSIRIDNLKVGVKSGAGAWAVLNDSYQSYAEQLGFVVDPARPYSARDKGKVERRVQEITNHLIRKDERFLNLADLNACVIERALKRAQDIINPVTGISIHDSWLAEREQLLPLPAALPVPFDVMVSRTVTRDCLVRFESREYSVPYRFVGRSVQVRGTGSEVQVFSAGELIARYPRGTKARLLIDQSCYEPQSGDSGDHLMPTPLGRLGREIVMDKSWEAAARPLAEYENLLRRLA